VEISDFEKFLFLMIISYLRIFWEQFYKPTSDESTDETQEESTEGSEILKKLTWKNQLERLEYHDRMMFYDEVKKKASAWFHVTYEPWIIYMKKNNRNKMKNRGNFTNNQQAEQQRFRGLFSFAWIVYPVLLAIFTEKKEQDSMNSTKSKKKTKNSSIVSNSNNQHN
jgi:hypothetical protein